MNFAILFLLVATLATASPVRGDGLPPSPLFLGEIHRDASGQLVAIPLAPTSDALIAPVTANGAQPDVTQPGAMTSTHAPSTADAKKPGSATQALSTAQKPANNLGYTKSISGAITDITVENTGISTQISVPVTFGQAFAKGDVSSNDIITGKMINGSALPLQFNVKAKYPDGSVRHAVISAVLPLLASGSVQRFGLVKSNAVLTTPPALTPAALLKTGFNASVTVTVDGQIYTASAAPMLDKGSYTTWLSGPIASEWLISAPLVSAKGVPHPHLAVRFAIRSYTGQSTARVDVTVENDWAYQPAPQNFTYDVYVMVGRNVVYSKSALTHYHHARWRKTFWWGTEPQINVRENTAYLIASKAVPNYDQSITISPAALSRLGASWTGSKTEPMGAGAAMPAMGTTGGRPDIGLMPGWAVMYLLSMDKRARDVTLGTSDLAGSWSIHYRDQKTDRPISIINYPYMTIYGHHSDTLNPATKKYEEFPTCNNCINPNAVDSAHKPAFSYLAYLLTGDHFSLEELQFWAMYDSFETNPGYRGNVLGLVHSDQVRGQAWNLRDIADAAYITPDQDPLKSQLQGLVANNLAYYNASYTNNPKANVLGINVDGYSLVYNNGLAMAPWMDDFFTSAVGRIAEQGFAGASSLLLYKAKFPVSRMIGPGYCWIFGSAYFLNVRPSVDEPLYDSIAQAYATTLAAIYPQLPVRSLVSLPCASQAMADVLKLRVGEMTGYSSSAEGFPSNLQPALAYAVDSGIAGAADAWKTFMTRSVKPDYSSQPQFAIVPR